MKKAIQVSLIFVLFVVGIAACGALGNCHPGYEGVCIPPPPPDLNCEDIEFSNFDVVGTDPHGFDGDNDGKGCE